jgi:putative restriction endonuclease
LLSETAIEMGYWCVQQGRTFEQESSEGFLWAPDHGVYPKNGQRFEKYYWTNLGAVEPGDIIFCVVKGKLRAVASATAPAQIEESPLRNQEPSYSKLGRYLPAHYEMLDKPVALRSSLYEVRKHQGFRGPVQENGKFKVGYIFGLSEPAAAILLAAIGADAGEAVFRRAVLASTDNPTTRLQIHESRIGQGDFRRGLLDYWGSRCCVSGLSQPTLLRASHIKPWRASNNAERLDCSNGLLLSPSYDAAFDTGFISFDNQGRIRVSPALSRTDAQALGIDVAARIGRLDEAHRSYLEYHGQFVFERFLNGPKQVESF